MQLLNAGVSPSTNRYKSYHDSTPVSTNFVSSDSNTNSNSIGSLPPWNSTSAQSSYGVGDNLSVSQVASMAFNCIAQCLTEGYRAASNYYTESTQQQGGGVGIIGGYNHNYSKVESSTVGEIGNRGGGYQDVGYQQQQQQMDRGLSCTLNQASGQGSTEVEVNPHTQVGEVKVKGEYATVSMPSTYQGGNKV